MGEVGSGPGGDPAVRGVDQVSTERPDGYRIMPMAQRAPARDAAPGGRREAYTTESLLAVAVQVFNERGYDGTSMEHLSKAAGISKSSIYHHVRGKEELLERAVGRALEGLFATLEEPEAKFGPAVERLEYVVRRTVRVLMAELPYVTLLLRVRGNTRTERWALERRRDFDRQVAELLNAAVDEGDLRADMDTRLATRLLFGMINSIVEWYRPAAQAAARSEQVAETVTRLAFEGLRAAPGER